MNCRKPADILQRNSHSQTRHAIPSSGESLLLSVTTACPLTLCWEYFDRRELSAGMYNPCEERATLPTVDR